MKTERKNLLNSGWRLALALLMALVLLPVNPALAAPAEQIGPAATVTTITTVTPSPAYIDQAVTVQVHVAVVPPAAGTPTGLVEIFSGQSRVCNFTLDASSNGSCTLSFPTPATVALKAIYRGTDSFTPSASAETSLVVMNKHTPAVELIDYPDPSQIDREIAVDVNVSSGGPVPGGDVIVWRGDAACTAPPLPVTATDRCSLTLDGAGAGSCTLPLSVEGTVSLCAEYQGDTAHFAARGLTTHKVSTSNTFIEITSIDPEPSLLGEEVLVSYSVTSNDGEVSVYDMVRVTSGSLSCTAPVGDMGCTLTFNTPHLHNVVAEYLGGSGPQNKADFLPSTSDVVVHRVNAAPTDIRLSSSKVNSFWAAGKEVGVLSATDPNPDESHTFALVAGAGDADNAFFRVSGTRLLLNAPAPNNRRSLALRLRATDPAGLTFEQALTLRVVSDAVLPDTGFAAGRISVLPEQPADKAYQPLDALVLEIPSLGVRAEITGVPNGDNGWDASWLWDQAGWLNGTAFPGWRGNSVLAAHNYLPNGLPGPFADLSSLRYGDQILVHAYGETSVYAVRSVESVKPNQSQVLGHKEQPWLTLVTCKTFDEKTGEYLWRVVVRAVLIEVR